MSDIRDPQSDEAQSDEGLASEEAESGEERDERAAHDDLDEEALASLDERDALDEEELESFENHEAEREDDEAEALSAPAIVDESAYAGDGDDDEDDDEDFGHLARLVEDDDEEPAARASRDDGSRPPSEHEIPLDKIDADALWVVKRLRAKGYEAYLTGGCVRDLLLGIPPKDFDVATAAHPNECKSVFRNCRLIGRRFRLAHVYFPNGKVIETATFRANPLDELEDLPEDLLVERDNVFGTVEDDARRRDLTINGLFYDPLAGKVIDFVDGRRDLEARLIRTIGDPQIRFQEDPVRILRAIKFATRLGFDFEENTAAAMRDHVGELVRCAPPRLQEELLRLVTSKHGVESWNLCVRFGVAETLLPELHEGMNLELPPRTIELTTGIDTRPPRRHFRDEEEADQQGARADDDGEGESAASERVELQSSTDEGPAVDEVLEAKAPVAEGADEDVAEEAAVENAVADEDPPAPGPHADVTVLAAPVVEPLAPPPTPEERKARLLAVLHSIDEIRRRDTEVSTSVVWAALVLPVWEAFQRSDADGAAWVENVCNAWTERMRMTRRDKDTLWLLLKGLEQLAPSGRRGHAARHTVSRPWFKESLLLYTIALHSEGKDLEEIGRWKAIAQHYEASYRQPRVGERAPRSGGGGRDRDKSRGGRRSRRGGGGGGGGGGGRGRGRGRGGN